MILSRQRAAIASECSNIVQFAVGRLARHAAAWGPTDGTFAQLSSEFRWTWVRLVLWREQLHAREFVDFRMCARECLFRIGLLACSV